MSPNVHDYIQHKLIQYRGGGTGEEGGAIASPNISVGEQHSPMISQALFCMYTEQPKSMIYASWEGLKVNANLLQS